MVQRGWIAPPAANGDNLTEGLLAAPATSKSAAVETQPTKEAAAKSETAQNTQSDTKGPIMDGGESASSEEDLVE